MPREHMIRVRASDDELRQLIASAQAVGLSLSAYLRWRGLQGAKALARQNPRPSRVLKTKRSS